MKPKRRGNVGMSIGADGAGSECIYRAVLRVLSRHVLDTFANVRETTWESPSSKLRRQIMFPHFDLTVRPYLSRDSDPGTWPNSVEQSMPYGNAIWRTPRRDRNRAEA